MFCELIVLSTDIRRNAADNVAKLSEFMGIENIKSRTLSREASSWEKIRASISAESVCIIARADTLFGRPDDLEWVRTLLLAGKNFVFLYGFSGSPEETKAMKKLTEGSVTCIRPVEEGTRAYGVDLDCPLTGQRLRGITFFAEEDSRNMSFPQAPNFPAGDILMTVNGAPFFIRMKIAESRLFIAGCQEIGDIECQVPKKASLLTYAPSLIPAMVFLREVFREQCWHNPFPKACFIIDDPRLTMDYGFLNYGLLLDTLRRREMSASIAFIPWNRRRTAKEVAALFVAHGGEYSLAIHGCDHTRAEFGSTDENLLIQKCREALERMEEHRERSKIPFDRVMIFPQGLFSIEAMKALKASGYLAAVNTTAYPMGAGETSLPLAELLDVAVMRYANFPLFLRRYPNSPADAALDMFLGKPALFVEHHGFFRGGYNALAQIADDLNSGNPRIEWTNLGRICSETCLVRETEREETHVRFYTDHFGLRNHYGRPRNYLLFRRTLPEERVTSVVMNGRPGEFEKEAKAVKIPLTLGPGESAAIKIQEGEGKRQEVEPLKPGMHELRVFVRRSLCEIRDNYLDKNQFLARGFRTARRLCRQGRATAQEVR